MQGIDFTSVHLYTDFYGVGDLEGQLEFVERSLRGHMNISEALNKPLIITEWGKLPPIPERNTFSEFIYDLAAQSASERGVLAGDLLFCTLPFPSTIRQSPPSFSFHCQLSPLPTRLCQPVQPTSVKSMASPIFKSLCPIQGRWSGR